MLLIFRWVCVWGGGEGRGGEGEREGERDRQREGLGFREGGRKEGIE